MNVTFACPHCGLPTRQTLTVEIHEVVCGHCHSKTTLRQTMAVDSPPSECALCHRGELFTRKDFSRRLGLTIIVTGFVVATVTWAWHMPLVTYGILGTSAAIDFALFFVVGNLLECYNCHAEYRGMVDFDEPRVFNHETQERYRQQSARLRDATDISNGH